MLLFNVPHLKGRLARSLPLGAFIGEITAQVQHKVRKQQREEQKTPALSPLRWNVDSRPQGSRIPEFLSSRHIQMGFIRLQRDPWISWSVVVFSWMCGTDRRWRCFWKKGSLMDVFPSQDHGHHQERKSNPDPHNRNQQGLAKHR